MNQPTPSFKSLFDEVVQHLEIEFSDYAFRKPLLEKQINKIGYRQSKEYNLVVLEIKQYFKRKILFQNLNSFKSYEPTYTGNCYSKIIVSLCSSKLLFNSIMDLEQKIKYVEGYNFQTEKAKAIFNYIYKEFGIQKLKLKYNFDVSLEEYRKEYDELTEKTFTDLEYKVLTNEFITKMITGLQKRLEQEKQEIQHLLNADKSIKKYPNNTEYDLFRRWFGYRHYINGEIKYHPIQNDYKEYIDFAFSAKTNKTNDIQIEKKQKVVVIKIKKSTIFYNKNVRHFLHPTNLKYWDKTTKKTSNRGLKADHYRNYYSYDGKERTNGWSFGGIKIDDIKDFCRNNGYKTFDKNGLIKDEKTLNKEYKKYTYGDMADWILHTLE